MMPPPDMGGGFFSFGFILPDNFLTDVLPPSDNFFPKSARVGAMKRSLSSLLSVLGCGALVAASGVNPAAANETVRLDTRVDRPLLVTKGGEQRVVIRIDVEGAGGARLQRNPVNLAVVLDRSGSMSGRKLEQAKQAARMLVDQLDRDDVFSLVVYDTGVDVLVPAGRLEDRKRSIQRKIDRLQTGGSTALYGGVETGGAELKEFLDRNRINRVILLSDGIANVGPSSNREIAGLGQRLARTGISVTTVGLGHDYNEDLMTALAEASDANYYYVADVEELPRVFRKELGELKSIVARDVIIRIECPKGVRPIRILGRSGKLSGQNEEIVFATLADGQSRELFVECVVSPDALGRVEEIAEVSVKFSDTVEKTDRRKARSVAVSYTANPEEADRRVDAEVVAEAAIYANAAETERAIALADKGDVEGSRANLVRQAAALRDVLTRAPAAQRASIEREIDAVERAQEDLDESGFSKSQRKQLQNSAYKLRNAKQ